MEIRSDEYRSKFERYTTGFVFDQLLVKQGIARYGRKAELKLLAEFKQLMEYKTFYGRKAEELTFEQRKNLGWWHF